MNILDKRDRSIAHMPNGASHSKVETYKWARPTSPGEMQLIHKSHLNIDGEYQREQVSQESVLRIARNWDWALFGVIKVAKRKDGSLWVFDGGHRTRASFYRDDITTLPCIVFEWDDVPSEARVFLAGAKLASSISAVHAFRAAGVAREPSARRTAEILQSLGITVRQTPTRANELKCVGAIQKAVVENESVAIACLEVCQYIAGDQPITAELFRGLFRLAVHIEDRDIIKEFGDRLTLLTQPEVLRVIRQLKAETGRGGEVIEAKGILSIINKGKRTGKIQW